MKNHITFEVKCCNKHLFKTKGWWSRRLLQSLLEAQQKAYKLLKKAHFHVIISEISHKSRAINLQNPLPDAGVFCWRMLWTNCPHNHVHFAEKFEESQEA